MAPAVGRKPSPVVSVPARRPGPRMTSAICTGVDWHREPGLRAKAQSWVSKGQERPWKLDDELRIGHKSLRSYSKKKSHPVPRPRAYTAPGKTISCAPPALGGDEPPCSPGLCRGQIMFTFPKTEDAKATPRTAQRLLGTTTVVRKQVLGSEWTEKPGTPEGHHI